METAAKIRYMKCLVWDLDNTLWQGTLAEGDDVQLREGIPQILKTLDERGILMSVASKNDHNDAMTRLKALGLDHYFLYPQINWGRKSDSVKAIQASLNIGFDAIAFIDDQPFEREEVNYELESVMTLDAVRLPEILDMQEFNPRFITSDSARRREMYQADIVRNEIEKNFESDAEFLKSLDMEFSINRATVDDLRRVEELTQRTNQLNATGYTYSYEELEPLIDSPDHQMFVCQLVDKYGTYGKIGVALLETQSEIWNIKLMLMSCRVMSRGVGTVLLHFLLNHARNSNARLQAEFKHTDRNRQMWVTYKFAGFEGIGKNDSGRDVLEHPLSQEYPYPDYIRLTLPE